MKAKLFKTGSDYLLRDMSGEVLAITKGTIEGRKLSKQNCDELFGVVDVEKLFLEVPHTVQNEEDYWKIRAGFIEGFNKAMELNKDKLFTLEDLEKVWDRSADYRHNPIHENSFGECIKSLQQPTEINVEIVMKKVIDETKVIGAVKGVKGSGDKITTYKSVPKLDPDGCLILKKI
jgi:hypothetical protein